MSSNMIECKYAIGEKAWVWSDLRGDLVYGEVAGVTVARNKPDGYLIEHEGLGIWCTEEDMYPTKEAAEKAYHDKMLERARLRLNDLLKRKLDLKKEIDMQYMKVRELEDGK